MTTFQMNQTVISNTKAQGMEKGEKFQIKGWAERYTPFGLDGKPLEGHSFRLVIASTLRRLFLRINPFWGREQAPIRFTALDPESTRQFGKIVKVLRGRIPHDKRGEQEHGYTSHNVFTGELSLDCGLTVDGELFPPVPGRTVKLSADERIRFVRS